MNNLRRRVAGKEGVTLQYTSMRYTSGFTVKDVSITPQNPTGVISRSDASTTSSSYILKTSITATVSINYEVYEHYSDGTEKVIKTVNNAERTFTDGPYRLLRYRINNSGLFIIFNTLDTSNSTGIGTFTDSAAPGSALSIDIGSETFGFYADNVDVGYTERQYFFIYPTDSLGYKINVIATDFTKTSDTTVTYAISSLI